MKIIAYKISEHTIDIKPARRSRNWMDVFPGKHPYRCLPMAIANTYGWELLCPIDFTIEWNGGPLAVDLKINSSAPAEYFHFAKSHFSRGIATLHPNYIFRTEPGWQLLATGPYNDIKDGITPLSGIIETDWLPYTFTMNWQMTRPGKVEFKKHEPFCLIYPIQIQSLIDCDFEIQDEYENPELQTQHKQFREARDNLKQKQKQKDTEALKTDWQKYYFLGQYPDGNKISNHINKLTLKEPIYVSSPN